MNKAGIIIHHWDTDGMASAAILLNYYAKQEPTKTIDLFVPTITNYYLTEEQYRFLEQQHYQFVITCDINFQAETIDRLAALFPNEVYVYDHHHQTPFSNVHYYNKPYPACATFISDQLGLPNNLQSAIALVGDKEEAIQQDTVYYPRVQAMMREHNLTFPQLLDMRRLIDSNYVVDDYAGIKETIGLLRDDPMAILTDVRLQQNIERIAEVMQRLMEQTPQQLSPLIYSLRIDSPYNILSQVTRNLSRQYHDKIIFTQQPKAQQLTCYIRRRTLPYDMRQMIAFARQLGLNAGGKEDVVGIIIPQDQVNTVLPQIEQQLKTITV